MLIQIENLNNLEILEQLTDQLFHSSQLEDTRKLIHEAYEKQQNLN